MKKVLIIVVTCFLLCALCLFCGCYSWKDEASPALSEAAESVGFMRVRVVDGMTDAPIEGAFVVLPETGGRYSTGADGLTELITLPCLPDERHDALLETGEGRTTVIAYAEGYVPYLLLYARVLPGKERETPTVYMFPDDGTLPVFEVIEAPPMDWAERVVERYRP